MGDLSGIYNADLLRATITLESPSGTVRTLLSPGVSFDPVSASSDSDRKALNITWRDHSELHTPLSYKNATGNTLSNAYPFNYGYWRSEQTFAYSGSYNGTWKLTITYSSIPYGSRSFVEAELVFGDEFEFEDIRTTKPNQSCSTKYCLTNGKIILATNSGYPTNQSEMPFPSELVGGGCSNWNAAKDETAWFKFTAASSTVNISISGMSAKAESIVVENTTPDCCSSFKVVAGGCYTSMQGSTGYEKYYKQNYASGYSQNHGYTVTGLTPGKEYTLIIDKMDGGQTTNFYIEIESGATDKCDDGAPELDPEDLTQEFCSGDNPTVGDLVPNGAGYEWYTSSTGGTPLNNSTPLVDGQSYYVGSTAGCSEERTEVEVVVNESPDDPIFTVNPATCNEPGQVFLDNYNSNYTYTFNPSGPTIDASGEVTGWDPETDYTVTVSNNGCTSTAGFTSPQGNSPQDPSEVEASLDCSDASLITTNGTYSGNTGDFAGNNSDNSWLSANGNTVENIGYYKFVADATTITFTACTDCDAGGWFTSGIQFFMFTQCGDASSKIAILKQLSGDNYNGSPNPPTVFNYASPVNLSAGTITRNGSDYCSQFTLSGLTIGETYYWGVDGYEGAECSYTITFEDGIQTGGGGEMITPTFDPIGPICEGDDLTLPTTSTNGINGTWSPEPNNTETTTYTFTPDATEECAEETTMTVIVNEPVTSTIEITACKTFTWDLNSETYNSSGTYITTLNGAATNGCDSIVTLDLTIIDIDINIESVINASCENNCDGSIEVSLTGAVPPYTYSWTDEDGQSINGNGNQIENLCPGDYTITINKEIGQIPCLSAKSITITADNPTPIITADAVDRTICVGEDINLTVSITDGGASPVVSWTGPDGFTSSDQNPSIPNATSDNAGVYTVTVEGEGGCSSDEATVIITLNELPDLDIDKTDVSCNGADDGSATVTVNGTGNYTYSWSPAGGNAATASNLEPGSYTVTVTDENGCENTETVTIEEPDGLTVTTSTQPADCSTDNGEATASVSGGTGNYTYSWNDPNGQTTATATNLAAGSYTVTVTDENGCMQTATANITNPGAPTITADNIQNVDCSGNDNGSISITVTGGTGDYTYTWGPDISDDATASDLAEGDYTVTVTDEAGCTSVETFTIEADHETPIITIDAVDKNLCEGEDIELTATITDGGSNPIISWIGPDGFTSSDQNPTIPNATSDNAGDYVLTVEGDGGCLSDQATVSITVNTLPDLDIDKTDISCNGADNGSATVTVNGTGDYTYSWSPAGGNTATASDLEPGSYTVTVTDENGCESQESTTIEEPDELIVNVTSEESDCSTNNGEATAIVNGGTGNYTYAWNDPNNQTTPTATDLGIGDYEVTVTDENGCSITKQVSITNSGLPTVTVENIQNTTCENGNDGSAEANASGGSGNYTYSWSNGSTEASVENLEEGNYTVTVTDDAGCSVSANISIEAENPLPVIEIDAEGTVICYGGDIELDVNVQNGVNISTYSWSGPNGFTSNEQNPTISDVAEEDAGTYTVVVTSEEGCSSAPTSIEIEVLSQPEVNASAISTTVCENGNIELIATTDVEGDVSYIWTGPNGFTSNEQNPVINGVDTSYEGDYEVTITTEEGCVSSTDNISITISPLPSTAEDYESKVEACLSDGATLYVSNPNNDYNYYWELDGEIVGEGTSYTIPANAPDASGEYHVIAQTEEGCEAVVQIIFATMKPCDIIIVETFSPNGDGTNDYFTIGNLSSYPKTEIWIYTRWGLEVYHSDDYQNDWDGTSQSNLNMGGDILPEGTYFYVIKLGGEEEGIENSGETYKGFVYLKR